jgi:hypothetical protein
MRGARDARRLGICRIHTALVIPYRAGVTLYFGLDGLPGYAQGALPADAGVSVARAELDTVYDSSGVDARETIERPAATRRRRQCRR